MLTSDTASGASHAQKQIGSGGETNRSRMKRKLLQKKCYFLAFLAAFFAFLATFFTAFLAAFFAFFAAIVIS